jgi:hypothetical protein
MEYIEGALSGDRLLSIGRSSMQCRSVMRSTRRFTVQPRTLRQNLFRIE